jgi:alpha-ketoglutarate-dependent taurine dioxygenase
MKRAVPAIDADRPVVDLDGVEPVAGYIGAEVHGIDLAGPLDDATFAGLRAALLRHRVLFFHDQRLTHADQVALGRRFGPLTRRPGRNHGPSPEGFDPILVVDPDAEDARYGRDFEERYRARWTSYGAGWHSDLTPAVNPPAISVLRAERVTSYGGDTQWTNLMRAYEGLAEPVRRFVDGLHAEHCFFAGCAVTRHEAEDRRLLENDDATGLVSVHPVVRVHPETGERALYVNPASTDRIIGLDPVESRAILDLLFEQMTRSEHTVRHRWSAGDVAIWDNRSTAHLGATDTGRIAESRTLYRVTVLGDRPVGPDGFVSESLKGDPLLAWPVA